MGAGVQGNLDIYITQDGHGVSLRKVLEMEILEHDEALRLAFAGLFAAMKNRPHMRAIILCPITQLAQVSRFFDIRRRRGSLGRL